MLVRESDTISVSIGDGAGQEMAVNTSKKLCAGKVSTPEGPSTVWMTRLELATPELSVEVPLSVRDTISVSITK